MYEVTVHGRGLGSPPGRAVVVAAGVCFAIALATGEGAADEVAAVRERAAAGSTAAGEEG
jgi:hypothetical protein